jgi:hypothetical protein
MKWIQEGEPATGKGMMTYLDHHNTPVSQVTMRRSQDGLWYVNNPILIPSNDQDQSNSNTSAPAIHKASNPIISEDASVTSQDDDDTDQDSQCTTEPTLHFDQLTVIAHHLHAINTGETLWKDPLTWPPISDESLALAIRKGIALPKLSRKHAQSL